MSSMRPPMFAGPIERHCKFFKTVSSTFACAKAAAGIVMTANSAIRQNPSRSVHRIFGVALADVFRFFVSIAFSLLVCVGVELYKVARGADRTGLTLAGTRLSLAVKNFFGRR